MFIYRSQINRIADERGGGQSDGTQKRNGCTNAAQENKGRDDGKQQKEQRGGDRTRCKCAQEEEEVRRMTQWFISKRGPSATFRRFSVRKE